MTLEWPIRTLHSPDHKDWIRDGLAVQSEPMGHNDLFIFLLLFLFLLLLLLLPLKKTALFSAGLEPGQM